MSYLRSLFAAAPFSAILCLPMFAYANVGQSMPETGTFDIVEVFQSCPIVYSILLLMSVASFVIWLYSLLTLRLSDMMPENFMDQIRTMLSERHYEAALELCQQNSNFTAKIISSGIASRKHGAQVMMDSMRSEGRRSGNRLWQRISLLNEVAVIAPMIGLLGTVIGLFLAFYNNTRTAESIASIFDGLGVAVGTTVVGLIVAIMAMIFYSTLKFRIVSLLNTIENETLAIVNTIESESKP